MKARLTLIQIVLLFTVNHIYGQAYLKGEWIGRSSYRDENNKKVGESNGAAQVYHAGINVPFGIKTDENERLTAWGIGLTGSYTSLSNRNMSYEVAPKEILNGQFTISHIRPFKKNWSLMAVAGIGIYTAHPNLSNLTMKNVLGHGGAVFIYHWKHNLDIGGGLAVNTSFGYPMVFPAFYLGWKTNGKLEVDVKLMNAMEVSAGINLRDDLKIALVVDINGALALEKVNQKDMMFTHQYIIVGFQPQLRLGNGFSIPVTVGFTAERTAYYEERSLKAFFKGMSREHDPHFSIAPYGSVALRYGF